MQGAQNQEQTGSRFVELTDYQSLLIHRLSTDFLFSNQIRNGVYVQLEDLRTQGRIWPESWPYKTWNVRTELGEILSNYLFKNYAAIIHPLAL